MIQVYFAVLAWRRGRRAEAINVPKIQKVFMISQPQARYLMVFS
jgi:hypothetical protein